MKDGEKTYVTTKTLARILGVDDSTIRKLTSGMVLTKEKRGTYVLETSVQRFIQYQLSLIKKNLGTSKADEETRLIRAKANLSEIELAAARREMVTVQDAIKYISTMITTAKMHFLSIPNAIKIRHPDFDLKIMNFIENEIRDTLEEMATAKLPEKWNEQKLQ
jgi:phage terminase Nu1 subunit (DNA packaging protein)